MKPVGPSIDYCLNFSNPHLGKPSYCRNPNINVKYNWGKSTIKDVLFPEKNNEINHANERQSLEITSNQPMQLSPVKLKEVANLRNPINGRYNNISNMRPIAKSVMYNKSTFISNDSNLPKDYKFAQPNRPYQFNGPQNLLQNKPKVTNPGMEGNPFNRMPIGSLTNNYY